MRNEASKRPTSSVSLVDRTRMISKKTGSSLASRMNLRLPGNFSTKQLIEQRGNELQAEFNKNKEVNFHDKYVKGEKLGEGHHASVYVCYERALPRSANECTPLPAAKLRKEDYHSN
jgi:hypothetical protein